MHKIFHNKKSKTRISLIFLTSFALIFTLMLVSGVFANHTSTATVTPNIVKGGQTYLFTAEICNDAGSDDPVDEVRLYENEDFTYFDCKEKDGWELHWIATKRACHYIAEGLGYYINAGQCDTFDFDADTPASECCRTWLFESRDTDHVWRFINTDICIDTTPPETTKSFDGPQKKEDGVEWIDGVTQIELVATDCPGGCDRDDDPHDSGVDKTWYINLLVDDDWCYSPQKCEAICANPFTCEICSNTWVTVDWCQDECEEDNIWNETQYNSSEECVEPCAHYCCDGGDHHGENICHPQIFSCDISCSNNQYDDLWELYKGPFQKEEESCHLLQYFSIDNIGNVEGMKVNCFFVDKTPPVLTKTVGEPKIAGDVFDYWITQNTPINLHCEDVGPHPSGDVTIYWSYTVDGGAPIEGSYKGNDYILYFPEDSVHKLEVWCEDAVEKESEHDIETFKVDTVPPSIIKTMIGTDHLGQCPPELPNDVCYVKDDGKNGVRIDVLDGGEICAVNEVICTYELLWEEQKIDSGTFDEEGVDIIFKEDSTHTLIVNCEDALGNEMVKDVEEFLVDSTPPVTTKTYGEPTKVVDGYRWITKDTEITLTATDEKVGVDKTYWRNTLLNIPDEKCLEECQCESPLNEVFSLTGNVEGTVTKIDNGDSFTWIINITSPSPVHGKWAIGMPFAISADKPAFQVWYREYEAPYGWYYQEYTGEGWHGWGGDIIPLPTEGITATGDHNGQVFTITVPKNKLGGACNTFYWATQARTNLLGKYPSTWTPWAGGADEVSGMAKSIAGGSGSWNTYTGPFFKPEDSCHLIEYYSVDKLGNTEQTKSQCVFVDNTAPESVKTHGTPLIQDTGFDWVNQSTEITLDCIDPKPHPVDQETLCYKVSFEQGYLTEGYCTSFGGQMNDGWCCKYVGGEGQYKLHFLEDSYHDLEYYCKDHLGNAEDPHIQWYKVDTTPPIVEKIVNEPYYGECPARPKTGDKCFVDTATEIYLEIEDGGEICAVGGVECRWRYRVGGEPPGFISEWSSTLPIMFPEECEHLLEIECKDALGNLWTDQEVFLVDKTPPTTTKTYGTPYVSRDGKKWITSQTSITLTVDDTGPHKSGIKETKYKVTQVDDGDCASQTACNEAVGSGDFLTYSTPFTIIEQSCHLIEYYSVDNVDKTETIKRQCVYVENTPPVSSKTLTGQQHACESGETLEGISNCLYITKDTEVKLTCNDVNPHPVDQVKIRYKIDWKQNSGDSWTEGQWIEDGSQVTFNYPKDSYHKLIWYCVDALGNTESEHVELDIVDTQAPSIEKSIIGPSHGHCPPMSTSDECFIDGTTQIHIESIDPTPHPVNHVTCDWDYTVLDGTKTGTGQTGVTPPFDIIFPEESTHVLTIKCRDDLGNEVTDVETFIVDKTPPTTTKTYGTPYVSRDGKKWITSQTSITLTVDDTGPHKSGIKETKYKVTQVDDGDCASQTACNEAVGSGDFLTYSTPFTIIEQSCHLIEYYSVDNVDKTETIKRQCVYVENTQPITTKEIIGSKYYDSVSGKLYIDGATQIKLTCTDPEPHPVNDVEIYYRYRVDDGAWPDKFTEYREEFSFPEESKHELEYYCIDSLGNEESHKFEIDYVDHTPPLTTKTYGTPYYTDQISKWITSATPITLTATDGDEGHASGVTVTKWRNTLVDTSLCLDDTLCQKAEGSGDWNEYEGPFNKEEESCHLIEYYSVDNVDKTEVIKKQCVFVDNSAPEPNKTVGIPKTKWNGTDSIFYKEETKNCWKEEGIDCWKVTLDTPITMTCTDPEPHPVDNERICFNVELDGEDWTGSYCAENAYNGDYNEFGDGYCCLEYTIEDFTFLESSEHNLKFYCMDALGNRGDIDEEKFKVEGNDFEIELNKKWNLVSVPVVLLNDDPEEVFEGVNGCVDSIWTYDGKEDKWYVFTPGDAPDNLKIKPGFGYWIVANKSCTLTIGGSLLSPGRTPPSRKLVPGWNLIGYYGMDDQEGYYGPAGNGDEAYCSLYSLVNTNALIPTKRWSSLYGYWGLDEPQFTGYGMCGNLDPGAGYWIHMPADMEQYTYAPSTGCPTAFWDLICGIAP